jgi:hypothetical protein
VTTTEADEIARAEQRRADRKALLEHGRIQHSYGEIAGRRIGGELKPVLLVGVVMAGVGATALALALARRAQRRSRWFEPTRSTEPSPLVIAAKSAGLWAMRLLVRRVAEELVSHLSEPTAVPGVAAPSHAAAAE